MERRVKLHNNKQRCLILSASHEYGSLKKLSRKLSLSYSTLKKYAQESLLLPESLFYRLLRLSSLKSKDFQITFLSPHWGRQLGAKKGMAVLERKYPYELSLWRRKAIENSARNRTKKIRHPVLNESLAEFIGVYLGDGTLSSHCLRISGDRRYDSSYFEYIRKLVFDLFNVSCKIYKDRVGNAFYIVIFSKELCSFLREKFFLKPGNKLKNNSLIPSQIIDSSSLALSCLRGLVDTDGSVTRRGRNGGEFSVSFFSANKNLLRQVKIISDKHGLFTYVSKKENEIGTNKWENVLLYFKKVGSSNLRHIVRFHQRCFYNKTLYRNDVLKYYQKDLYRDIRLPFKLAP